MAGGWNAEGGSGRAGVRELWRMLPWMRRRVLLEDSRAGTGSEGGTAGGTAGIREG